MKISTIMILLVLIGVTSTYIYLYKANVISSIPSSIHHQEIFHIITTARSNVRNSSLTLQEQNTIGEKATAQIIGLLSDYSYANDLDATLRFFLEKNLGISVSRDNIHTSLQKVAGGMSGNIIIKIDTGKRSIIIKVYRKEHSEIEFFEEISTMYAIQSLRLKHITSPRILGLGKCTINNKKCLLLAQEYAPGMTIKDIIIDNYLKNSIPAGKRVVQKALTALGKGLAELHYARNGKYAPIHPLFIQACEAIYKAAANIIAEHPEYGIDQKALSEYFTTTLNNIRSVPITYGFMHTDTNLGNYIYDANTETLYIIDVCHGVLSFAKDLTPIGMPGFDVVRVKDFIASLKAFGLTKEENTEIQSWFMNAYLTAGGINPTEQETAFYELISCLQYIMWLSSNQEIGQKNIRNRFLEQKFLWLKETL